MVAMIRCSVAVILVSMCNVVISFSGWIDPDTPSNEFQRTSYTDGETYELVMSDEFNRDGRTFEDGHDPMWTGIEISDDDQSAAGRKSLQYYNSSKNYITTRNGNLVITTTTEDTTWKGYNPFAKKYESMKKTFRSGMAQSWNKFCFTGGIMEVDVQFPGHPFIGGLWPAVWLMGNLGRATYLASTNLLWPWSYPQCDRTLQRAQEISGCDSTNHFGLNPKQGRGATEIDVIEVMAGQPTWLPLVKENLHRPYSSMTLQTAPGVPASKNRPQPASLPEWGFTWYKNITYGENTSVNPFFYGTYLGPTSPGSPVVRYKSQAFQADAISSMVQLNESHFNSMHTFRLEWQPGENGYLHWYMDGKFRFGVEQEGLHNAEGANIPNEPSYLILNTAISTSWGFPNPPPGCKEYDCKTATGKCGMFEGFCTNFPAQFLINHVRVYQNKNDSRQTLGCNPREYPTTRFIAGHAYRYKRDVDEHPLKPIVTGGGRCTKNAECGEGSCRYSVCKCKSGWQGPNCLVPTYSNDFPDWEQDDWALYSYPYFPPFLQGGVLVITLILGAVVIAILRHGKPSHDDSGSSSTVQSSLRGYQQVNSEER